MTGALREAAARSRAEDWAGHYDRFAIALHWLTAFLVVSLFALAEIWGFLPHGALRKTLEGIHVSLGCLLVVVVVARILWRLLGAARLSHPGMMGKFAEAGHGVLYLLLLAMIVSGPLKRWAAGHALTVFWLFAIPSPIAAVPALRAPVSFIHFWAAWAIIVVAGLHAAVALFHHYALKDGVLRRMLPGR